ncbi:MAG: ABC transporter permease [OM182 bacterium MED-G28]|uniref:ABC transporter permease n=1 Tax=OM182 bacterium MED-G28 TaxID=1986256 RepID=A0A2A5WAY8_9GAMM|nr:MAG: ABC transporter permease [OM182 bacterium MED-G28]
MFEEFFIFIALLLLVAFFGFTAENFFSTGTLTAILTQLPALTVVTIGMTLVLITGGIDLSVGSVVALSSAVIGIAFTVFELPLLVSGLLGIAAGGCAGLINGVLGAYFRLPIFIVTLGMLEAGRGMAYLVTNSQTVYIGPSIQGLALPISGIGVSASFLTSLALVVLAQLALTRTVFGRYLIAIGTNETAAKISGIRTEPYLTWVLVISGLLAGLGGLMNAAYLGASDPNAAIGLELSAIAAAVIGGTSLMGGRGSIIGAFIGVLIISVLQNGLAQLGVSEPFKRLITGLVIILAVLIDRWRSR